MPFPKRSNLVLDWMSLRTCDEFIVKIQAFISGKNAASSFPRWRHLACILDLSILLLRQDHDREKVYDFEAILPSCCLFSDLPQNQTRYSVFPDYSVGGLGGIGHWESTFRHSGSTLNCVAVGAVFVSSDDDIDVVPPLVLRLTETIARWCKPRACLNVKQLSKNRFCNTLPSFKINLVQCVFPIEVI